MRFKRPKIGAFLSAVDVREPSEFSPGHIEGAVNIPLGQIHAGHRADPTGAVNVPIYQTSTFAFRDAQHGAALFAGQGDGYIYTRIGNPTIRALEESMAELENGCGGIATSSGMGAVSTLYSADECGRSHGEHGIGLRP
jgi:cystathionine beta-lyase/cystathionine gamma-synthase